MVLAGSGLASYAAACVQDPRFAADLLLKIDVHDELDGASGVGNWTAAFAKQFTNGT